jgi:zinc protease
MVRVPGHAELFEPSSITLATLPNGVRGVVRATRGTGLVAVQVWVRAGSRYETTHNIGVSHLVETVAMESSRNYPRASNSALGSGITGAIDALGGTPTSQTSRDATNYSATVAAEFLPAAMRALADATLHPRLTDVEIENAKLDVQADLQQRAADPIAQTADMAYYEAFTRHPYRWPAGGTDAGIEKLTGAIARAYHAARYVGANISVIVVGDVHPDAAHKLIARYFGEAVARKTKDVIAPEAAPLVFHNKVYKRPGVRSALALAFRAPGMANPTDVVATDVLLSYWSEGSEARLRHVLLQPPGSSTEPGEGEGGNDDDDGDGEADPDHRNDNAPEPLALGFDVNFLTQRDPSLLIFSLVIEPDKKSSAIDAVLHEVGLVRTAGISEQDLRHAKLVLQRQYIEQSETVSGQASALGFYEMISTYQFAVSYLDRIDRIKVSDIKHIAAKYMGGTAYVQASIEPSASLPGGSDGVDSDEGTVPA